MGKIYFYILLLIVSAVGTGLSFDKAEGENTNPVKSLSTGIEDQTGVALTIYNVNLGLVKDKREITLPQGALTLRFMGVAAQIIPASVHIKSLIKPDSLSVLEQNYEYDLLNPQKLLDKYVGKEVKLYYKNPYTEREDIAAATLLSNNDGPIFKLGDGITFGYPGRVIFPGVPEDLISRPTLVWLLENSSASAQTVEASYLTNGLNWRADYVLTLNERDDRAGLSAWVTIDNKSGAVYKEARLKLVAGDVHRVKEERAYKDRTLRYAEMAASPLPQFKEEDFFEYHIYTLQRPSTLKENQTKQITLVTAEDVPVKKELVLQGTRHYYSQYSETIPKQKVSVFVELVNGKKQNLGIPLPKGIVRVYKQDKEGSLQFVGEDSIEHTPKDEKIRVKLGEAFDVVAARKQIEWKKIASDTYEAGYEVALRNHKKEDVVVRVVEPIPGAWIMLSSSHEYKKADALTAEFTITVPKDKEVTLAYKVRMRY